MLKTLKNIFTVSIFVFFLTLFFNAYKKPNAVDDCGVLNCTGGAVMEYGVVKLVSSPETPLSSASIPFPIGMTMLNLMNLAVEFDTFGTYCGNGSPYMSIVLDLGVSDSAGNYTFDQDNQQLAYVQVRLAPGDGNGDCPAIGWQDTGNLVLRTESNVRVSGALSISGDTNLQAVKDLASQAAILGINITAEASGAEDIFPIQTIYVKTVSMNTYVYAYEPIPTPTPLPTNVPTLIPSNTPTPMPLPTIYPIEVGHCKNGGWRNYDALPQLRFRNQGDCVSWFISNENALGNHKDNLDELLIP